MRNASGLVLSAVLLAAFACGGSNDGSPAPSAPTVQHSEEVQRAIDELEGKVGFRPVAPTYLPAGLDPAPETTYVRDETQQTAILAFFPSDDQQATPTTPAVLDITEDPATSLQCPLCPSEGLTELEVGGAPALAEEGEADEGVVFYVLYFIAGEVLVTLNGEWDAPEGSGLTAPTAEMKQELVRVAESMVAQV